MKRIILALSCTLLSQLAMASYFAQDGISSMMLRSAEMLPQGQKMLDLSVFLDSYDTGVGTDKDGTILPGFAYGLNDELSLGLSAPIIAVTNSTIGLRELNAIAKYRLGGSREEGVAVSLSGFASIFSADSSEGLGSGERSFGLALNVSLYGDVTTLNLSLGGEKSNLKTLQGAPGFSGEFQLMLAGGIEYQPRDKWLYLLEGVFTRTNSEDDNFLLMPGLRYTPDQRMSFYAGVALGLPSDASMPSWRVTTGVSVNLGGLNNHKQARRRLPAAPVLAMSPTALAPPGLVAVTDSAAMGHSMDEAMAKTGAVAVDVAMADVGMAAGPAAVTNVSAIDALMLQQIEALRSEVGRLINAPPNVIARVEIQNASGIRGLGEKVAKLLIDRGYSVVSIRDISRPINRPTKVYYKAGPKNAEIVFVDRARLGVRRQTRIYFIEGFQQRATRVSLTLPGSQRVVADNDLVNVAEIRIVIGKDMRALLKHRPIKLPST